jgi:hypothetical protein
MNHELLSSNCQTIRNPHHGIVTHYFVTPLEVQMDAIKRENALQRKAIPRNVKAPSKKLLQAPPSLFDGLLTSFELTFKQGYAHPKGY